MGEAKGCQLSVAERGRLGATILGVPDGRLVLVVNQNWLEARREVRAADKPPRITPLASCQGAVKELLRSCRRLPSSCQKAGGSYRDAHLYTTRGSKAGSGHAACWSFSSGAGMMLTSSWCRRLRSSSDQTKRGVQVLEGGE